MKRISLLLLLFLQLLISKNLFAYQTLRVLSPDKNISLQFWMDKTGEAYYSINYKSGIIIKPSHLGLIRNDESFAHGLSFIKLSQIQFITDRYELYTGKKRIVNYKANKATVYLKTRSGKSLHIIFQVSNDGVAFRYYFPDKEAGVKTIIEELTSFHFNNSATAFLQPMQVSKTGWEKTNPAYEEHYKQNISVTDTAPTKAGWVYPALFNSANTWVVITETGMDGNYCATHLQPSSPDGEYRIGLADAREVITGKGYLPSASAPFYSPWRIITIGSLKIIAESTLGTDLAKPAIQFDKSFIKPGKSSWSWIMSKDDSIVYTEQIRYIDFAAKMNWQYCLVDAAWDKKIGYEKAEELGRYAKSKNVGLLLWYNSAGDWNTVKYTPKNKLLTQESRVEEFNHLKEMGIKGVKIDFFPGDGQSVVQYYIDILEDAAKAGLLVNFHGATLPRGWHRTYPHLLTTEAVRGFEMITFNQSDADLEATHCAMLPFTRNIFDPMDFTPMNLYKIQTKVKRKTTSAFELATTVLFTSGIQHFAESPAGMDNIPDYVQAFLKELPVCWDDVKFIEGYPGKYVVLARRAGKKWYLAGINADTSVRKIIIDREIFGAARARIIMDGAQPLSFNNINPAVAEGGKYILSLKPSGGFIMVIE